MANLPLVIKRGDTFRKVLTFNTVTAVGGVETSTPLNLTGWTVAAQVRATKDSATVLATFTATIVAPATDGKVQLLIAAATTALLTPSGARPPYWDLQFTKSDGDIWTPVGGEVEIDGDVTRP
jgi:hypothetical protein